MSCLANFGQFGHFQFGLDGSEAGFREGIVVAVGDAAHALAHGSASQDGPVLMAGILSATVAVMDQFGRGAVGPGCLGLVGLVLDSLNPGRCPVRAPRASAPLQAGVLVPQMCEPPVLGVPIAPRQRVRNGHPGVWTVQLLTFKGKGRTVRWPEHSQKSRSLAASSPRSNKELDCSQKPSTSRSVINHRHDSSLQTGAQARHAATRVANSATS